MSLPRTLLAALLVVLGAPGCGGDDNPVNPPGGGRTIHFPGDAATLQAAVDLATRGDTVLVEPGTHDVDTTLVFGAARDGVVLVGRREWEIAAHAVERPTLVLGSASPRGGITVRSTAEDVTIRGLEIRGDSLRIGIELLGPRARLVDCRVVAPSLDCVLCSQPDTTAVIEGNLLLDPGRFAIDCSAGASPLVNGNTIVGARDCGIFTSDAGPVCARNIVFGSTNWGFACFGFQLPTLSCNALFNSGIADYSSECAPGADDIHADPLFCDATSFAIRSDSPCAAANDSACGQIGAVGVACSPP